MKRIVTCFMAIVWGVGALSLATAAGCYDHDHGWHREDVDTVDAHGYHHQGYYDQDQHWHGGYYDENHSFHNDPDDWHK